MTIPVIHKDEDKITTVRYLDCKYSYEPPDVSLRECFIYQRGQYLVVEHKDKVYFYEHVREDYCYLQKAIDAMVPEKPAAWKTLRRLITLRQAIRENTAQQMGYENNYTRGLDCTRYKKFVRMVREQDVLHHGQKTF